jgi:hypothetical protein
MHMSIGVIMRYCTGVHMDGSSWKYDGPACAWRIGKLLDDMCGLPTGVVREFDLSGAGFGHAVETYVIMARVRCMAGHQYDAEMSSIDREVSTE